MALPIRLLAHLRGGRRRLLPPLLFALPHLSAPTQNPYPFTLPPPLPFAVPSRSFSWYSRSGAVTSGERASTDGGTDLDASTLGDDAASIDGAIGLDASWIAGAATWGDDAAYTDGGIGLDAAWRAENGVGAPAVEDALGEGVGDGGLTDVAIDAVTNLLDGFHNLTGLPWWIIISFSTVAFRLSLLPVFALQTQKVARIGKLFPKLPPPMPPPLSGKSFRDQYSLFRKKRKELGCPSFLWNFAYIFVQLPCFILWMVSIRTMCLRNHPGFDNGGTLWFHNLTELPHGALGLVFPVLVAGLHYLNVQLSFQTVQIKHYPGIFGLMAKYHKLYLDILTIPFFLIACAVPQGSLVYWTTNGLFTVFQQLFFRNDVVRKILDLPDIRGHHGNTAQNSPLEGHSMRQQLLGDAQVHPKLTLSDNRTDSWNTTPNILLEGSSIMEENVSKSSSPKEMLELALQYLGAGSRDRALPLIRSAIEKEPDLFPALISMGQTLFSNKLFPEALECFEHAIPKIEEHDPLLVLAYFSAALSHNQLGNNKVAIELLLRLAELKEPEMPLNKACYFQGIMTLGCILSEEGRKSEALKYVRLVAAYDPGANRYLKECEDAIEDEQKSAQQ